MGNGAQCLIYGLANNVGNSLQETNNRGVARHLPPIPTSLKLIPSCCCPLGREISPRVDPTAPPTHSPIGRALQSRLGSLNQTCWPVNRVPSRHSPVMRFPDATLKWEPARRPFWRGHLRKAVGTQRPVPQRQGGKQRGVDSAEEPAAASKPRKRDRKSDGDTRDPTGKNKRAVPCGCPAATAASLPYLPSISHHFKL